MPLSGQQSQHFNYIMHCVTLQKISCIYKNFCKWTVSNHSGSTWSTQGCGRVWLIF